MEDVGREPVFVKFLRTRWLPIGHAPDKDERCLSIQELRTMLSGDIHVSEKLDGANVGIAKVRNRLILQKRGGMIQDGDHPQYGRFKAWAWENYSKFEQLPDGCTLFGEWLWAKHSIRYTKLTSHFVAFDVYYRGVLVAPMEMERLCIIAGIESVPLKHCGAWPTSLADLVHHVMGPSSFSDEAMEGFVVKSTDGNIRGKYVRSNFIAGSEHWSERPIVENSLVGGDT